MKRLNQTIFPTSGDDVVLSSHLGVRLALCVVVMLACAALFCGGTFAWFTDSATCSVEKIQAKNTWETSEGSSDDGEEDADGSGADNAAAVPSSSDSQAQGDASLGQGPSAEGSAGDGDASTDAQPDSSFASNLEPDDGADVPAQASSGNADTQAFESASDGSRTAV